MSRLPRIGLIGTGEMARTHVGAWQELGVAPVVFSRDPGRGSKFATEHGLNAESDLTTLLGLVDAVDICTPTDTHADLAIRAAAAGRQVICEKPIARTEADALRMIDACREAGVHLLVGHTVRYLPPYAIARRAVLDGRIGRPQVFRLHRGGEFPPWANWFADLDRSGGVLLDLAIHDLDYARWLGGPVERIDAELSTGPDGGIPYRGRAVLTHADGATSEVTASWEAPGIPFRPTFEMIGTEGRLSYDSLPTPRLLTDSGEKLWEDDGVDPYAEQLADFVAVLAGEREPIVTAEDALEALRIALRCTEHARASA